jgi:hypothetical protein
MVTTTQNQGISSPTTVYPRTSPGVPLGSSIQRATQADRRNFNEAITRISPLQERQEQSLTPARRQDQMYEYDDVKPTIVQGDSLRTWSFTTDKIQCVQVHLSTEGRPLNAKVDVWTGPDSTPQEIGVYIEDGSIRPFNAMVFVPRSVGGQKHAVAIKNKGTMEFPLRAAVEVGGLFPSAFSMDEVAYRLFSNTKGKTIQGGSVRTVPFSPSVASVQLMLTSDGRPLNARIEMLQGPDCTKQVMEVYTEDGAARPFFAIIETPGYGNVVRIVNTGPMEFPIECRIEPYTVDDDGLFDDIAYNMNGRDRRDDLFFLNSR